MYLNLYFSSSLSPSSPSSSSFSPGFHLSKASLELLIQPLKCWTCWCEPLCLADSTVHPSNARLGRSRLRGEFRLSHLTSVIWDGLLHWAPTLWVMMGYFTGPLLFRWWLHWHQKWGISLSARLMQPFVQSPTAPGYSPSVSPLLLPTPSVSLPHWILLFWVVWGAPNSSVVDFNFTSWALFTNLGMGLLHKIKPTEECRNQNLDSAHGRRISFWTDNSHI